MSIDPDLRIALGFILLLRVGIGIYSRLSSEIGIFAELRRLAAERPWPARLVWVLLAVPLIPFLMNAQGLALVFYEVNFTVAEYSIMWLPDILRLLLLIPAVAGLLLVIWSRHCAIRPAELRTNEPSGNRFIMGPFRSLRFPQWLGDLLLFGPLLVATGNWGAVISFFAACLALHVVYFPHAELAWQRLLGDGYGEYAGRTGAILPRIPSGEQGSTVHYSVPKRFGLSAVLGLMTMFAVMFGGINLLQSRITEFQLSPTLHLFFGLQLMAIWVGQMRFGGCPRRVSAFVGAVLLPTFVFFTIDTLPSNQLPVILMVLFFFGGVIGYCLGTITAGLFLVMDWLGPYLPGARNLGFSTSPGRTGGSASK